MEVATSSRAGIFSKPLLTSVSLCSRPNVIATS
jgi:hypothetical protein